MKIADKAKPLTIVFVSSEAAPYSKTGGLADVAGSLPKALAALGHKTHLITPLYKQVAKGKHKLPKRGKSLTVPMSSRFVEGKVLSVKRSENFFVHFIEQEEYFNRDHIYQTPEGDYKDNSERFIYFSRAALDAIKMLGIKPDVIHLNDWQTALIPAYLKTVLKDDPVLGGAPTLLTIHNLGYQGRFWKYDWHLTGLDWELFINGKFALHDEINLLKGGIEFADFITTVSQTYAKEIQTREMGHGLDGALRKRAKDISGIINGIDADVWNPQTDSLIPANYSAADISGKKICKAKLLKEMGLPQGDEPVLAVISRLVEQKGHRLLLEVIDKILDLGARLVLLGSGEKKIEQGFLKLAAKRPDRASVRIGYDEKLAHRIEAGADMLLMPSLYEPCGLNQIYSLAYGTAPIVRATGGLNDTVIDYTRKTGSGNGFKFKKFSSEALLKKTEKAITLFKTEREVWYKMVKEGMDEDHSWSRLGMVYENLYRKAVRDGKKKGARFVK